MRRTRFVQAHASALACIALSGGGRLLATASEKGTLVRVWSTADGSKLQVVAHGLSVSPCGAHVCHGVTGTWQRRGHT